MLDLRTLIEPHVRRGLPAKEIYAMLRQTHPTVCRAPVYRAIKRLGGKTTNWMPTEIQKKRIAKMIANGLRFEDIASIMGVATHQIINLNHRQLKVASPAVKDKKINREALSKAELNEMYLIVLRTMAKRFKHYREDIPSAVADAVVELQNKPKSDRSYKECFGIAQRRLIDHLRARKGRTGSRRQNVIIQEFPEDFEPAANSEAILDREDEISWLRGRIKTLDEHSQTVLNAYLECNLNCAATARMLGVSEPTAAKYIQIAIKRVKDESDE